MTRTTPELAPPLQTSAPHQREDVWPHTYDLTCNKPTTRQIFSGIRVSNLEPSGFEAVSFALGQSGLISVLKDTKNRYRSSDIVARKAVPGLSNMGDKNRAVRRTFSQFFSFLFLVEKSSARTVFRLHCTPIEKQRWNVQTHESRQCSAQSHIIDQPVLLIWWIKFPAFSLLR
ncbi:hypothetical protein AVEN_209908-1 [Araneus ventricosus]|uniref:Uncharacterized protein n=1 Tax=Araneus ventricosus TaxID=182803 RepID=A0A4Y2PRF1_ARAVE|nr:hypothetical protein AVEN_209908-1 [Araneus ventricosus]